jgi:Domain of unknown function (DUF4157)
MVSDVVRSPGLPLDAATRMRLEPALGRSLADVRVHTDARAQASAQAVHAFAYTVGSHIVFAAGDPVHGGAAMRRLVVHELAHVTQQERPSTRPAELRVVADDHPAEREAEQITAAIGDERSSASAAQPRTRLPAGAIARQRHHQALTAASPSVRDEIAMFAAE